MIFCCVYTALSLNKKSTYNSLPDNIFLQTETGQIHFHKKDRDLYCYGLNTCGKISDLKDNYFHFTYNHFYKTKFFKTGSDIFSNNPIVLKQIDHPLPPFQFSFNYKQANQIIPVKCDKTGLCQKPLSQK